MEGIFGILQKILNRLFGYKWICEYCGALTYDVQRPLCKPCCHVYKKDVFLYYKQFYSRGAKCQVK